MMHVYLFRILKTKQTMQILVTTTMNNYLGAIWLFYTTTNVSEVY
jgi:hypothetical protein